MVETTYRITPKSDSTFTVEITGPGQRRRGAYGFRSEAEAEAWVAEKKRMATFDENWKRYAPRQETPDGYQET
jgi:hypothetical protein